MRPEKRLRDIRASRCCSLPQKFDTTEWKKSRGARGLALRSTPFSVRQCVDDGDLSVDLNGLSIEDCWLIAPFAHGGQRGLDEERVAADDFKRFNVALLRNNGVQFDTAFAAGLDGERWIDGLDAMDEPGGDDGFTDANRL
jgi:hypothetical protein